MEMYEIQVGDRLIGVPWWWFDVLLGWLGLMGFVLWLFGKPLIKPTAAALGLVFGAFATFVALRTFLPDVAPLTWTIGAGMAAAVFSWLLWRLWLGVTTGGLFATAAVAACVAFAGIVVDPVPGAIATAAEELRAAYRVDVAPPADDTTPADTATETEDEAAAGANGPDGQTGANGVPQWEQLRPKTLGVIEDAAYQWWEATEPKHVALLLASAAATAVLGLVLGILFPNFATPLVIAHLGVLFMLGGTLRLIGSLSPSLYDTATASGLTILAVVGGLGLFGACVQWGLYRRKSTGGRDRDKKPRDEE